MNDKHIKENNTTHTQVYQNINHHVNCRNVNSWSNWFKLVQKVKLDSNELSPYVDNLFTIDEYYAKSSLKAWDDTLQAADIDRNGQTVMIGNGSSDIAPKTLEIPSIIIKETTIPTRINIFFLVVFILYTSHTIIIIISFKYTFIY